MEESTPSTGSLCSRMGGISCFNQFAKPQFWRDNFNLLTLYACGAFFGEGFWNGSFSPKMMVLSSLLGTVMTVLGGGRLWAWGHAKMLKAFKVDKNSGLGRRLAANLSFAATGDALWFAGLYGVLCALGVLPGGQYLRSLGISAVNSIPVCILAMNANALLNNFATNDPAYLEVLPKKLSKICGCADLSAATKRKIYYGAAAVLSVLTLLSWKYGQQAHNAVFGAAVPAHP